MKVLIVILALLISQSSMAASTVITGEALKPYIRATQIALQKSEKDTCLYQDGNRHWDSSLVVGSAQSLTITDGTQPLLIFSMDYFRGEIRISITTDATYTKISSVLNQVLETTDVNKGTLKNPNIQKELIVNPFYTCGI